MRKLKNILITGGCGFIGSNFIRYLFAQPNFHGKVINLDELTYAGNLENLIDIANQYEGNRYFFIKGNICNFDLVKQIFQDYEVDTVVHFAAESHVDRSILGPADFIQTNINGTFTLLEAARVTWTEEKKNGCLFYHISTDEVYGSLGQTGFFSEDTPYRPNSPYSASKAASDHLVRAYYKTYGLPVIISNCTNNYGPYQFPEKLIPLTILNAFEGKPIPVYGKGENIRDWIYVEDHCEAVWLLLQKGKIGEQYNIGGANERRNIDVVRLICNLLDEIVGPLSSGPRENLITFVKDRPGHDFRYAMNIAKIKSTLGWRPKTEFKLGLTKTINWYLNHKDWVERIKSGEYQKWVETFYGETKHAF
ncbi:MAG: dTDP-glucose 4,6-dehydratase [Candidatus Desulfofervidaceae bacterium]|nr:dTDP-glucose 4,6-dehydratase [Candidatus Desulfofervidaceae bacterium]